MRTPWLFYCYALVDEDGTVVYAGKGTSTRLANQRRRYGLSGFEIARFRRESDAYAFERAYVAEHRPTLNRCAGGAGSRVTPKPAPRYPAWFVAREDAFYKRIKELGSRRYCAEFLQGLLANT